MSAGAAVRVNWRAADRVASGHPWIFASDIVDRGGAEPGAAVRVFDPKDRLLGSAHYSSSSQICLRMLSSGAETVDEDFFSRRISAAQDYRARVVDNTDAYRVVYAEGDLLPALIVDRYGEYFVIQTLNQGMDRAKDQIVSALSRLYSPAGIAERNDSPVRRKEDLPLQNGILRGEMPERVQVRMNGLKLHADLMHGQKTGVFLDQRENYLAAAQYGYGRVLDCFTSTGGFALHLSPRCDSVQAIDSSALALEIAELNQTANGLANVSFEQADVFDFLSALRTGGRTFNTIVLDPPAFAKTRENVEGAARGYKDINVRAMRLLERNGILVTCSCSHHVSEAALLEIVAEAALDAGRTVRIIERRTQAKDHPILLTVPETLYLKCLILQVL